MATGGKNLDETTAQPTTTKSKGNFTAGYECEFVEPPPKILATECSICLHIPREPYLVSCCGQHFCKSCIKHAQSENKPCPLCNQIDFTAMFDKSMQRNLNALKVYCTNKEQGCEWVGELRNLDHHLNANPKSGEELTGCEFVELSCIHGCGGRFQRRSFTEHHNNCPLRSFSCEYCSHSSTYLDVVDNHWVECPKYPLQCPNNCEYSPIERKDFEDHLNTCPRRPFSCEYCSYSSTYQDVVNNHMVECPKFPLPCPNNCEESPIERQHLEDHLNKDCPLEMVNCEFQFAGCTARVQRKDQEAHMKDNLPQHISQLSSTTRILVTGMRDEMNQKFEQQMAILKDQMKQRQLETEGVVKQEQAEVKARQDNQERQLKRHKDNLERQLEQHKPTVKTVSDDTQQGDKATLKCYGMTVVAIIVAFVAVLAAIIILQHQQIQQLQQDHTVQIQQLQQDHTVQIQQLQQDHTGATEQIQQLRQDHIKATEQIQQLQQDHFGATEQIQQLQQDHFKATEQIQQLQQDHVGAIEQIQQLRQDLVGAIEQIQQLRQDHFGATEQIQRLRQDHIGATIKLSGDLQNLQYQLHHASLLVSPPMCTAEGPGLYSPTVNKANEITVSVVNIIGSEYTGTGVSVTAELESEEDGSIIQANVFQVEASKYRVTYTSRVRGWSKLHVKINNIDIKGSPFILFVSPEHSQELKELNGPWGVAINSRGEIYVTEWFGHRVTVFDANRQKLQTIGSSGYRDGKFWYPAGIDIDMDDNVYVASEHKLQKFNRNGEHIKSIRSSKEVRGVRVHNDKIYVCVPDNHHILVYDQELMFIRQFGTKGTGKGEFDIPYDIAFDGNGNAYVVDFGNNRVQVLKEDGIFLRQFGREKLNEPRGILINGDYVYVSQFGKVVVFRTSGDFVTTIGENLGSLYGITTKTGKLYVCEKARNHCIIFSA